MTALYLTQLTEKATINAPPPFEAEITYSDQSTIRFASSIENGVPTITNERATWLRDSSNSLLFDNNKQLLEV